MSTSKDSESILDMPTHGVIAGTRELANRFGEWEKNLQEHTMSIEPQVFTVQDIAAIDQSSVESHLANAANELHFALAKAEGMENESLIEAAITVVSACRNVKTSTE